MNTPARATAVPYPATRDVQRFIDAHPLSALQIRVVVLCLLIVAIDGIDIGLAAYIAPSVRREWGLSIAELSPVFVSGLVGMMVGSLIFGPLADRWGRRPVLIASVAFFGVATLATLLIGNVLGLSVLRFVCGMGIGGATPTAATLTAEYAPERRRLSIITIMLCGNSLGSALGGVIASQVISRFGWQAMLVVGGAVPIALLPALWFGLPESMRFLALRRPDTQPMLRALARRIAGSRGDAAPGDDVVFVATEREVTRASVRQLLSPACARGTLLLWTTFFMGLMVLFLMANWLPTILTAAGASMRAASLTTALWSVGGTCGGLLLGQAMDRFPPHRVLALAYTAACVLIFMVGRVYATPALLAPIVFLAGFCISGSQVGINGLAAEFYPTAVRATGVAWATGIGRIGSMLGSALGGYLLAARLPYATLFTATCIPMLIAALCMSAMRQRDAGPSGNLSFNITDQRKS
ncbi:MULTISPECIES: MFS transporter [Burkholderia]|uniref:MFS transporter n=1 Tax=Burkholderia TaxID=32008 RepID=UPI00158A2B2B|nr:MULTISPECIES: MFS transporter [Burkholderia]MBY4868860.1 MFS transporter [Burkholderia anthina]